MVAIKVLLDTNFLLTMVRYKIHGLDDINAKAPCEFYTLSGVLAEMKALSRDKKIAKEVKIVELILKSNKVKVLDSVLSKKVDDEMVEHAREYVIATNDKVLRKRVQDAGGKTMYLRSLTTVEMDGEM